MRTTLFGGLMTMFATVTLAAPPASSPLLGTWQADVSHSSFQSRAPYRSATMTFSAVDGRKVRVVADVATASGVLDGTKSAAGDAARGKSRSAELYCDACHGVNGNSENAEWPSLASQNATYIARQLELFRSRARSSSEMQPIAASLSDSDIADLAAHYTAQTVKATAGVSESKAAESLYRDGDSTRSIPACSSCHGADGRGNPASGDPALRAQQPIYSSRQLESYAKRTRYVSEQKTGNLAIMYVISEKLTAEEINGLADYLHAMP